MLPFFCQGQNDCRRYVSWTGIHLHTCSPHMYWLIFVCPGTLNPSIRGARLDTTSMWEFSSCIFALFLHGSSLRTYRQTHIHTYTYTTIIFTLSPDYDYVLEAT